MLLRARPTRLKAADALVITAGARIAGHRDWRLYTITII